MVTSEATVKLEASALAGFLAFPKPTRFGSATGPGFLSVSCFRFCWRRRARSRLPIRRRSLRRSVVRAIFSVTHLPPPITAKSCDTPEEVFTGKSPWHHFGGVSVGGLSRRTSGGDCSWSLRGSSSQNAPSKVEPDGVQDVFTAELLRRLSRHTPQEVLRQEFIGQRRLVCELRRTCTKWVVVNCIVTVMTLVLKRSAGVLRMSVFITDR